MQHDAAEQTVPNLYCSMLNIPQRPHALIEPKPYLGIHIASVVFEQTLYPACTEKRFIQAAGIVAGSPAAKAGIKEKDIILSFNGVPACYNEGQIPDDFKRSVEQQTIGVPVRMEIQSNDQRFSITALPEARPMHQQPEAKHPEIGQCQTQPSLLQQQLDAKNIMPMFNNIIDELYIRSNINHNPGSAHNSESDPLQLKEVTYALRHPLSVGVAGRELSQRIIDAARNNQLLQGAAALLDMELPFSKPQAEISFPILLQIMDEAKSGIEKALSNLSPEEKALLREKAIDPWNSKQWSRTLAISAKVDRAGLFGALSPLLSFLTPENLPLLKEDLMRRFGAGSGPILYDATTSLGRVIVGGIGPNVYTEDAALILDLGGDDLYLNNAGGTRPGMPVALVIDWGGNNQYISRENFSQGAGLLGGGLLLDLGQDATFSSLDGSQGAGFWGLGLLYHGSGKAAYQARRYSQGTGQMGIGMLICGRGDDHYSCSFGGQGLGLFGGAGLLIDQAGDDTYQLGGLEPDFRDPGKSTVSMGQGFGRGLRPDKTQEGVPGGIGMLIDQKGNDRYIADYFAQGASYYYGLGILRDLSGDDQYLSGRYSQGAGIHSSIGFLLDEGGNDSYYASFGVAQGLGHDFGIGVLEDSGGNNRFWGGTLVQGAATNGSIGILIDLSENGQRMSVSNAQAYAQEENSIGLMISKAPGSDAAAITTGIKKH
ncbi:MAG: PDZ domain-containing protein [Nitrospirae bacterium]|nr:PDZ domain-containing protein [Nitrospirota bacterium]